MAQINFPVATANGQTFEAENGVIYTYVGTPPNGYWSGTFQDQGLQTLDGRYLKLDASNDPITSDLTISKGNALLTLESTANNNSGQIDFNDKDASGNAYKTVTINSINTGGVKIHANPDASSFATNSYIAFSQGSNERLRIDPDGNVGIGTVSPTAFVDLLPSVGLPTALNSETSVVSIAAPVNSTGSTTTGLKIGSRRIVEGGNTSSQSHTFLRGDRGGLAFDSGSSSSQVAAQFTYSSDSFATESKALTVLTSGYIGIGTDSPAGLLHVASSGTTRVFLEGSNGRNEIRSTNGNLSFFANGDSNESGIGQTIFYRNGSNESMRINASGYVGIGTTNPTELLTIDGNIEFESNTKAVKFTAGNSSVNSIEVNSGSGPRASIDFVGAGSGQVTDIVFKTSDSSSTSTERMRIKTTSGNVGIGTDSPAKPLHVSSATDEILRLETPDSQTGNIYQSFFDATGVIGSVGMFNNMQELRINNLQSSGSLVVRTADTERMRVDSSGNVGIGASSPTQKLDLEGDAGARIAFTDTGTKRFSVGNAGSGVSSLTIRDESSAADRLVINNAGNVGIGTSNPTGKLEIAGNTAVQTIQYGDGTTTGYFVSDTDVNRGTADGTIHQYNFRWNGTAVARIKALTGDNTTTKDNGYLIFETNSGAGVSERMRIDDVGNIGIGKATPETTLHLRAADPKITLEDGVGSLQTSISGDGGELALGITGTEVARFTANGLTFMGDTAATSALDDYEEGTWTPTFVATTTNPTVTYSVQNGLYTKIGNVVTVQGRIRTASVTAIGSGSLRISGLPFTPKTNSNSRGGVMINFAASFNTTSPNNASVRSSTQEIELNVAAANSQTQLTTAELSTVTGNRNDIMFAAVYMTP